MMETEKHEPSLSDYAYIGAKDGKVGVWWICNSVFVRIVTQKDGFDSGEGPAGVLGVLFQLILIGYMEMCQYSLSL